MWHLVEWPISCFQVCFYNVLTCNAVVYINYRYGKTREIQTQDLNTTRTLYIQFALASGNESCGGVDVLSENTILLQFSLDQGITWNTLQSLGEISVGVQHYQIVLPQETKYPQTRFRLWQPYAVADNYNVWSIDDILIGGVDRNNPMLAEEFDPFDRNKLAMIFNHHS